MGKDLFFPFCQKMVFSEKSGDLLEMVEELLLVLSEKERAVITKRFSLDNKPRQTLENIGRTFSVTRERVRQIEATALKKLQRNASNSRISRVSEVVEKILIQSGGLSLEKEIITRVLALLHTSATPVNGHAIRLALAIMPGVFRSDSPKSFYRFWFHRDTISMTGVKKITKTAYILLKKSGEIMSAPVLVEKTAAELKRGPDSFEQILSVISTDMRFRMVDKDSWGLQEWRHINPKSIHDKALIIMRKRGESMHFIEITNAISEMGFDKKPVTTQAVHNDLIRYPEFVLVGRGMYALREWGYNPGTVADVIAAILKKEGPLSKKEIVKKVQEQRDVKTGTISLNLQKEDAFVRVGRAVYEFSEENWNPAVGGRGRKKKAMLDSLKEGK